MLRSTSETVGTEDDKVEVQTTIDMKGNVLKGAVIRDSALNDLEEMGVTWLTVRGAAPSRLAFLTENSTLAGLTTAHVNTQVRFRFRSCLFHSTEF